MMKSAVTLSLTPEARGGPFVFWDDRDATLACIRALGFDGVELFLPGPERDYGDLAGRIAAQGLRVAAVGTGAGWVLHRLSLTDPDGGRRAQAREFIRRTIDLAAAWQAPAIIGSMQGRSGGTVARDTAQAWLGEALMDLGAHAAARGQPLLYEPLNRYESDLCNRQADAADWLASLEVGSVRLLSDLFHMNLEESDLAAALLKAGPLIGHIHFADSNRRAMGWGHTDSAAAVAALRAAGYCGYLSAEILPWPDPVSAARQMMTAFRHQLSVSGVL